jgi:hypothetical protein
MCIINVLARGLSGGQRPRHVRFQNYVRKLYLTPREIQELRTKSLLFVIAEVAKDDEYSQWSNAPGFDITQICLLHSFPGKRSLQQDQF